MSGTKPSVLYIIARDFRGSRLYLAEKHGGNGFRWVDEASKATALRLGLDSAMDAVERASREYGAACAVLDEKGNLLQTATASHITRREADMRSRMAREVANVGAQRASRHAASRRAITAQPAEIHRKDCGCEHCGVLTS